jgi:hypothetical protein
VVQATSLAQLLQTAPTATPLAQRPVLSQATSLTQVLQSTATTTQTQPVLQPLMATPTWTELIIDVGDVAPSGRVEIFINTMVMSATSGTEYKNVAT